MAFIVFAALNSLTFECAIAGDRQATADEQKACTPDVFRLCSSAIPDVEAITSCLRTKFTSLSDQCRYVISVHESAKAKSGSK
ncbi:hypothetical protein [Bradyrhizobium sp. UFLA05-112]